MTNWRKSSRSGGQEACVEIRSDLRAIRDSKLSNGAELTFAGRAVRGLSAAAAAGRITRDTA